MTYQIDLHSATWLRVKAEAEERIKGLREKLEAQNCDPRTADFIRGEISALRQVIAIPTAGTAPDVEEPAHYID